MNIRVAVEKETSRVNSVTAGAPCLLIVCLNTFREIKMYYIAHIGFMNPHPESNCSDHNLDLIPEKKILILLPLLIREPGMIRPHRVSLLFKIQIEAVNTVS
jgi:hypothetical protein